MAQKINESLDFQSQAHIENLPAPAGANEPARKTDLDAAVATLNAALAGFDFIDLIARVAATTNITLATPGASIDGLALTNGDIVLLTGQTTHSENGLWVWHGATSALTRATVEGDAITYQAGSVAVVGPDGSNNENTLWLQTTDSPVVGSTALTFTQFGQVLVAGTGISISGTTIALSTPVSVGNGGTNATTAAGARASLSTPGIFRATFGDGAASSFAINHALGQQYVQVTVVNISTGQREDCAVTYTDANHCQLSAEAWTASPPGAAAYEVVVVG